MELLIESWILVTKQVSIEGDLNRDHSDEIIYI